MSYPFGLPKESLLAITGVVSNRDFSGEQWNYVMDDMIKNAAHHISRSSKVTEEKGDYITKIRLEVLVLNPEDFYRIVQEEAAKMNSYSAVIPPMVGD